MEEDFCIIFPEGDLYRKQKLITGRKQLPAGCLDPSETSTTQLLHVRGSEQLGFGLRQDFTQLTVSLKSPCIQDWLWSSCHPGPNSDYEYAPPDLTKTKL